jgi:hypothetical protein
MDYRAITFAEFPVLTDRLRALFTAYLSAADESEAAGKWRELTVDHDDQAAALLAIAAALSRIAIRANGAETTAFGLIDWLHLLAGDRLYASMARAAFDDWRSHGQFDINLANGEAESGTVHFNHGQLGASLHEGFDLQGVTAVNRIPRVQWNYRLCDGLADIDLDGFSPWNFVNHLTYANSDPRQWYSRYVEKFGDPGFAVERVGNVPELRVEDSSVCSRSRARLNAAEQTAALAAASRVAQVLADSNDFRGVVEGLPRERLESVLRDTDRSPLASEVSADVLDQAAADDLIGYYAARVDVERLTQALPSEMRRSLDAVLPASIVRTRDPAVSSTAELAEARRNLERLADEHRQRAGSLDQRLATQAAPPARARAWLSGDTRSVFGYRTGTRFVAAETSELQLLLAPAAGGYNLLYAVPRTKH